MHQRPRRGRGRQSAVGFGWRRTKHAERMLATDISRGAPSVCLVGPNPGLKDRRKSLSRSSRGSHSFLPARNAPGMTLIATRLLAPRNDSYLAVPLSWAVGPADR